MRKSRVMMAQAPKRALQVMELLQGGELFFPIVQKGSLVEAEAKYVVVQVRGWVGRENTQGWLCSARF